MPELSGEAKEALRQAGWIPGRKISLTLVTQSLVADGFPVHGAAIRFLEEFGNLAFDTRGAGISRAREPFAFNPLVALGEADRFSEWSEELGHQLVPVGDLDNERYFLAIDEQAEIFIVADWLARFGPVVEALDKLVLGVAPDVLFD